jgi:hypothetical protein
MDSTARTPGNRHNYIVYSPSYDENRGGVIFLHQLVHVLNEIGERAYLWPAGPIYRPPFRSRLKTLFRKMPYSVCKDLNTPIAHREDISESSIMVYPELVRGNPLNARNVVRWLLYRPGLRHDYEFSPGEMFFRVGGICDIPELTGGAPDLVVYKVNRSYINEKRANRSGICFIVRKGDHKPRIPETEAPDAIQIDGKSHAQINDIFNRCHTFYSYDEATMYSQYAAVCGCVSIVIPGLYGSREEWVRNYELARYGVAYGLEDIPHAVATQDKVLGLLEAEEARGIATVEQFVRLTRARFWSSGDSRQ